MLSQEIKECPHCGSTESYTYILILKGEQTREFGNNDGPLVNFDESSSKHGACRCDECNKIIKEI